MTAFTFDRLPGSDRIAPASVRTGSSGLRQAIARIGRVVSTSLSAGAAYQGAATNAQRRQVLDGFAARS